MLELWFVADKTWLFWNENLTERKNPYTLFYKRVTLLFKGDQKVIFISAISTIGVSKSLTLENSPVEIWINNVCVSHSNNNRTREGYLLIFKHFCGFICKSPNQIMQEYEATTDREFKRQYAKIIRKFIASQHRDGFVPGTISSRVGTIMSFFKYNDLPLGFIPAVKHRTTYHNRDLTHEEIRLILDASRPRERAFFAIMAQSGLRPHTICNLKYENLKEDFEKNVFLVK